MTQALLADLDFGSVPAWFGGISFVLAITIFMRDRSKEERSHIDLVGVWWEVEYERRSPMDPHRIEEASITLKLRNSGNLPVELSTCYTG